MPFVKNESCSPVNLLAAKAYCFAWKNIWLEKRSVEKGDADR
jgi:hypothetical protein